MIRWEEVEVASHQFHVGAVAADLTAMTGETDVFALHNDVLIVHTGIVSGPVRVGVEVFADRPEPGSDWENSAEATIPTVTDVSVVSADGDVIAGLGTLRPPGADFATVRVSTKARGEQWGEAVSTSTEVYLIEVWPSTSPAPNVVQLKSTDGLWQVTSAPQTEAFDPSAGTEDASVRFRGPREWRG